MASNKKTSNKEPRSEYGELVEFLGKKFDNIDKKFDEADKNLEQKLEQKLARKADKSDIERVLARVSMVGGKVDEYNAEQAVTQRQVDRHEKWHHQTAQKIGIKLED